MNEEQLLNDLLLFRYELPSYSEEVFPAKCIVRHVVEIYQCLNIYVAKPFEKIVSGENNFKKAANRKRRKILSVQMAELHELNS